MTGTGMTGRAEAIAVMVEHADAESAFAQTVPSSPTGALSVKDHVTLSRAVSPTATGVQSHATVCGLCVSLQLVTSGVIGTGTPRPKTPKVLPMSTVIGWVESAGVARGVRVTVSVTLPKSGTSAAVGEMVTLTVCSCAS